MVASLALSPASGQDATEPNGRARDALSRNRPKLFYLEPRPMNADADGLCVAENPQQ